MGGKAKFQKHTAKELADKQNQKNKGGGGAGIQTRLVAKLNFTCDICKVRPIARVGCARACVYRAAAARRCRASATTAAA